MKTIVKYVRSISILLIILFSACSPDEEREGYLIGFSQAMTTDNWRKEMNRSMRIETSLHPELDLEVLDAAGNIQKQIEDINLLIDKKVDVLIVSPIQSAPITPIIEKAMSEGISTIVIDRKIEGSNYTAYVGANNVEVGGNAAKYILSHASHKKGNIIEIKGLAGSSPAYERSLGFRNVINKQTNLKIIGTVQGDWEKHSVEVGLKKILDSTSNVNYIFTHNDRMAQGALEVARKKGLDDNIIFVGVDGLYGPSGGIQLVKDGILSATILYPTGGSEAIRLAKNLLQNEVVEKNNILKTVVIDSVNVDIMQNQFNKLNQQQTDIEEQQAIIREQITSYNTQNSLIQLMAFLLFLLLILALYSIYLLIRVKRGKRSLEIINKKIVVQRNQIENFAKQLRKTNETKINFFTALSHEFKTPLTLITSSVESLSKAKDQDLDNYKYETRLIMNNSKRLLRLINELLDFRKLETRSFVIKPSRTNIYEFFKSIFHDFKTEAAINSIDMDLKCTNKELELYIDRNMMDKVFFNLLSNALKFTPKNGKISVRIEESSDPKKINIYVKDSGIGIPSGEQERIFDPYFQATNNLKPGSGMGLYLTREFVKLHGGTVSLRSKKGTEFCVSLLEGTEHLKDYIISQDEPLKYEKLETHIDSLYPQAVMKDLPGVLDNELNILLIEDNLDLANLIQRNFHKEYNLHHSDGTDAIEKALDIVPDAIICDLNLPDKSGFEICKELKNDLRTSHIPVIILTALNDEESRIKALRSGADFYITKPFNLEVLKQSVVSVLYNREKLRYYYTNRINEIEDNKLNTSEQEFLKQLNEVIDKNLQDQNFSVEELSNIFNISRVHLYRKVKAMLGLTVNEYINSQRLAKGKYLLEDTNLNVSEIAYSVGYSSPGYFSTSFKNKYGLTPKKFRDSKEPLKDSV
ncbi:substrate-binding domain-containing protein [Salinimicrobium sp. MT39]|uniref:histidine kinase n=1 Tax=Salinimicrobium profundisediminis TaxID=2994553 RepID=A0A9X3I1Y2_9FLAO|nr:substrate-binding domain-containing protein [Salinimicrobium profundisediminis]MCX2839059.1 substrate-binding domain-containing protein [Salinimicrobium profundisediminis]